MSEKVTLGKLIRIINSKKKATENEEYISLQIEDETGKKESCVLFTDSEIKNMETVSIPFMTPQMKTGRIYSAVIANKNTYLVKVMDSEGEKVFRLSKSQLLSAESRAARNPEDLTKKSFLTDLFD